MKKNHILLAGLLAITLTGCGLAGQTNTTDQGAGSATETTTDNADASTNSSDTAGSNDSGQSQNATDTQADSTDAQSPLPTYQVITNYFSENYKGKYIQDKEGNSLENKLIYKGRTQSIMLSDSSKDSFPALYEALKSRTQERITLATDEAAFNTESATQDLENSMETDYPFYESYYSNSSASLSRADEKVVSICNYFESFLGGAHGIYGLSAETYDVSTGAQLNLSDVLTVTEAELVPILKEKILATATEPDQFWDLDETLSQYKYSPNQTEPVDYDNYEYDYTWYLDHDGVHFYFGPYEVAAYAYGATDVVLSYDELKGQINENYLPTGNKGYITQAHLPVYPTEYDDDTSELHLVYEPYDSDATLSENDYLTCKSLALKEKDRSAKVDIDYDYNYTISSVTPYKVVTDDGRQYIYVTVLTFSDYTELEVFEVTDTAITHVGEETLHMTYLEDSEGYSGELVLTDPDNMLLGKTGDLLGTYTCYARYEVGPDGMPKRVDDAFTIAWGSKDIKLLKDISATTIDEAGNEGTKETIPAGTIMTPVKTDNESFVDCQIKDGKLIRLRFSKTELPTEIDGEKVDDLFEGLLYAG